MRSSLRNTCWVVSAGCLLVSCGPETPPERPSPSPSPSSRAVTLAPSVESIAVGQTVTLRATVPGDDKPVLVWSPYCESGKVAVAVDPLGTSATITAERAGACFMTVVNGQAYASSWITIPPLPLGDACSLSSECAADAPIRG